MLIIILSIVLVNSNYVASYAIQSARMSSGVLNLNVFVIVRNLIRRQLITTNEMYPAGQSLEHVSWIAEGVDRETEAHYHHEQADHRE